MDDGHGHGRREYERTRKMREKKCGINGRVLWRVWRGVG